MNLSGGHKFLKGPKSLVILRSFAAPTFRKFTRIIQVLFLPFFKKKFLMTTIILCDCRLGFAI